MGTQASGMEELGGPSRERLHSGSKGEAEEEALSYAAVPLNFSIFSSPVVVFTGPHSSWGIVQAVL